MNDTTDNSTRLNQFAGFLANNPDAVKNISMIADMMKAYANQIVLYDLRDALNSEKGMDALICKDKDEGQTNVHQWVWNKGTLVHDITNPHLGHFAINTFYNANSTKWEINMMARQVAVAKRYIKALKEKEPNSYKNTFASKNIHEKIMEYVKTKKFSGKYAFNINTKDSHVFIDVDIIGKEKNDIEELKKILKDMITNLRLHD